MADETPENKPNRPNIQKPVIPPNNASKDKGLAELNRKLEAVKIETIGAKESAEKNTDKVVKALEKNTEETKPKKKSAEELSEAKKENKKFLDSLKGMFEGIKKGLTGGADGKGFDFLKPLLLMWGVFKRLGLLFAAGGLLSMVKIEDIEKVFHGIGKMFSKMIKFFKPILTEIGIYLKDTGIPAQMNFLLKTFESMGQLFDNLGERFKGWTTSGWSDRLVMVIGSMEDIGGYVIDFSKNVIDLVFDLFGYEGSVTKDVRKHMNKTVGPKMTDTIVSLLSWVAGLMTVTQLFGPKFLKPTTSMWEGGWWRGAYFLLRTNITNLLVWVAGLCATWPFALAAAITVLTVTYADDISKAVESAMKKVTNWFTNLPAIINNALVGTSAGKLLGLSKMKMWDFAAENNQQIFDMQREKREAAKVEVARLQEWKRMSVGPEAAPGQRGLNILKRAGFDGRISEKDADKKIAAAKIWVTHWDNLAKDWAREYKDDLEKTNLLMNDPATAPKSKATASIPQTMMESGVSRFTGQIPGIITPSFDPVLPGSAFDVVRARNRAKGKEAFMPFSYPDNAGKPTRSIGYGFNLGKPEAQSLLNAARINATVKELWNKDKGITVGEASILQRLESHYYTEQAKKFAGDLWGPMTAMQKEGLWDMSYQMGSLMQNTGLKQALMDKNNKKILWEIMENSLYGRQTPGRAKENAEMLMYKNQTGAIIGDASTISKAGGQQGGGSVNTVTTVSTGDNVIKGQGSAHQQNNIAKRGVSTFWLDR